MDINFWKTRILKVIYCMLALQIVFSLPVVGAEPAASTWDIGQVNAGQCLYTSLREKPLLPGTIEQILAGLKPQLNFRKIRPDTAYHYVLDGQGELLEFAIESGRDLVHLSALREEGRYALSRQKAIRRMEIALVSGCFCCNLDETLRKAGEAGDLSRRFEAILAEDLDPEIKLQEGDRLRLVVEKIYGNCNDNVMGSAGGIVSDTAEYGDGPGDRESEWLLRYGRIEAFEVQNEQTFFLAIRYKNDYYDESGRPLKKVFLQSPLHYQYVSCEFMKQRRHPILGGVRPHRGVDLVAPVGTPVWAVADGEVVTAGWLKGYGRTVILRHTHGYESLYAHLSDFGPLIRKGARVRQKQVVGYIGTTGLTTGPHLHFGLTRDGKHRDPFKEVFPRRAPLAEKEHEAFKFQKQRILSILTSNQTAE